MNYPHHKFGGENVAEFFGSYELSNVIAYEKKSQQHAVNRLKDLIETAENDPEAETPPMLQHYWELFRGGILFLGAAYGLNLKKAADEYGLEDLSFILMDHWINGDGKPDFVKKLWDHAVFYKNMFELETKLKKVADS